MVKNYSCNSGCSSKIGLTRWNYSAWFNTNKGTLSMAQSLCSLHLQNLYTFSLKEV